jgi:hypothetical protein
MPDIDNPLRDALLARLIEQHGRAGPPDIAPALQTAEGLLRQAHSINEMVPIYRRLLAS